MICFYTYFCTLNFINMNKKINLFLYFSLAAFFMHCKNDKQAEQNPSAVGDTSETINYDDPLIIPLPKVYYHPPGLRPLNLVQMYDFGSKSPDSLRNLPIKNKHGEPVSYQVLEDPSKPVFMQMYADETGRVVEAVIYEMNDTIKNLMMNTRRGK